MIENKIYAGEQRDQLSRYHEKYPEAKLLFLTLEGRESRQKKSKGKYESISYRNHIITWLAECKKIAVDKSTLRETLTQYIKLIEKLTNQNMEAKMNEELMNLFGESKENFDALMDIQNIDMRDMRWFAMKKTVIPALKELQEKFEGRGLTLEFETDLDKLSGEDADLCGVHSKNLREKNLYICFQFANNTDELGGGFACIDHEKKKEYDYTKIKEEFEDRFKGLPVVHDSSDWWVCYFEYSGFWNWSSDPDHLKNLIFGNFKEDLESKIETMLEIVKNVS